MSNPTFGEHVAMPTPEAWATPEQVSQLNTVVDALHAEAQSARRLADVRVVAAEATRLELDGGQDRLVFTRGVTTMSWTMLREHRGLPDNEGAFEVQTQDRALAPNVHGGQWKRKYERHAGTVYAVGDVYGRDVLDPLTGKQCSDLGDQLISLIPARRRTGRLAAALALRGNTQQAA